MKKLLTSAAVCGLVFAAAPAHADIDLELGGYFKGYGAYVNQDEPTGFETNDFDMIRDTEIHIGGETTLDNGLIVGTHFEFDTDGGDSAEVDESYVYFSGNWGRVNVGAEDGAGYLLQVAAPSADSNIDGIRQYVQPVNYDVLLGGAVIGFTGRFDYDMNPTSKADKVTYLSPILSGFQLGASFTPDSDGAADDLEGIGTDKDDGDIGRTYELAARYEGMFNNIGVILGAGYSHGETETTDGAGAQPKDDRKVWNVGADFDVGPFGLGVIYKDDNVAQNDDAAFDDEETLVVGADYTTGPFKLGASYFDQNNTFGTTDYDTKRYSGGVTYTYGPGMTFRGSVGHIEHDVPGGDDVDATYVTLGTQINF